MPKQPGPGWNAIAVRTRSRSEWDALPNAAWTIEEAMIMVAQGCADRRDVPNRSSTVMEIKPR